MDLRFSDKARALLAEIRAENPSDTLVILIGGGCCENATILMKNFRVGRSDRYLGEGEGISVYAAAEMFPLLTATPSILDVTDGRGAGISRWRSGGACDLRYGLSPSRCPL